MRAKSCLVYCFSCCDFHGVWEAVRAYRDHYSSLSIICNNAVEKRTCLINICMICQFVQQTLNAINVQTTGARFHFLSSLSHCKRLLAIGTH